ncbi:hypothetical protein C8R44DRAFT_876141 [Mycena epipterygia]|nr:hypothetical protein C8R44DRAFT_876141 [Mycena epipterygia]
MAAGSPQSDQQRLELVAGLAAAADALRTSCAGFTAAAEVMRHCAKLADDWADTLKQPGASNGKRKAGAEDDDEPAANGKRKRVTKKKDPNAPKRPASSYLLFQNEIRKEIKEKFPAYSNNELLNVIKNQWADMTEAQKAVYHNKMTKEKERYTAEKTAYDARSPEEVARADAEVAAAIALKKATPRVRKPKAEKPAAAPVVAASSEQGDSDEEEDDEEPAPVAASTRTSGSSESSEEDEEEDDDDDDEEDEEPAPKKSKIVPAPAPVPKEKKKKSKA